MWCYRRTVKAKWTDKIGDEEVLKKLGKKAPLEKPEMQIRALEHIIKYSVLLKNILEKESGKRWI